MVVTTNDGAILWQDPHGDGNKPIYAHNPETVLDIMGGGTTPGTPVIYYQYKGKEKDDKSLSNQQWGFST